MSEPETSPDLETEEAGSRPAPRPAQAGVKQPRRAFLGRARRELKEEELTSATTCRFLIEELDRAEDEIDELRIFRDRFFEADKKLGILEERNKAIVAADHLAIIVVGLGGAGLTLGLSLDNYFWYGLTAISVLLIVAGYLRQVYK